MCQIVSVVPSCKEPATCSEVWWELQSVGQGFAFGHWHGLADNVLRVGADDDGHLRTNGTVGPNP